MQEKNFKIYTKQGDKGFTKLLGGTSVPKSHPKVEAYGTIDELNSFIGLIRDSTTLDSIRQDLLTIQNKLFVCEAIIASDNPENLKSLPNITESEIVFLEVAIDKMNMDLPELKNFILPGGSVIVSYSHVARCVCRRAERAVIQCCDLSEQEQMVLKYLNRLSDYFFVLARWFGKMNNSAEVIWKP